MTHGSLFSGIGGFDLAADWMGWENKFHCELNPFCQKILKHYWPNAASYENIKQSDFTKFRGLIDVLSGGFPCQPYSAAGKRRGPADDRHLWPEMLRAFEEIRPRFGVGENVRGLINWGGGLVFREVQSDLENIGYGVIPFLLPACGVNAPHKRDRIWFIAYSKSSEGDLSASTKIQKESLHVNGAGGIRAVAHSDDQRIQGRSETGNFGQSRKDGQQFIGRYDQFSNWQNFPAQHPVCSGNDGLSGELDGITFSKWRKESLMSYGNAIVPQVAYEIFRAIAQYSKNA